MTICRENGIRLQLTDKFASSGVNRIGRLETLRSMFTVIPVNSAHILVPASLVCMTTISTVRHSAGLDAHITLNL